MINKGIYGQADSDFSTPSISRRLNDLSLQSGKKLQVKETGFIHILGEGSTIVSPLIPLYDNFVFAYALLRSKLHENMLEARELIGRLLHFQNKEAGSCLGNFPVYLHDYPLCRDRYQAVFCLTPLYLSYLHFHSIFGYELILRVQQAITSAMQYIVGQQVDKAPTWIKLRAAVLGICVGKLLEQSDWVEWGKGELNRVQEIDSLEQIQPHALAENLTTLSWMPFGDIPPIWHHLAQHAQSLWHQELGLYVGPHSRIFHQHSIPEVTLYDYWMSFFHKSIPQRLFELQRAAVYACLIPEEWALPSFLKASRSTFQTDAVRWECMKKEKWTVAFLDKMHDPCNKGYCPCYICFKGHDGSFTACLYHTEGKITHWHIEESAFSCSIRWDEERVVDDKDKARLLHFFIPDALHPRFFYGNEASSVFEEGEEVLIVSKIGQIRILFKGLSGKASLLGHVCKASRFSTLVGAEQEKRPAEDWNFFVRVVEAKVPFEVSFKFTLNLYEDCSF